MWIREYPLMLYRAYLDFPKAFDNRLLMKIEAHGIGGKIIDWIKSWLFNRKQRVVLSRVD